MKRVEGLLAKPIGQLSREEHKVVVSVKEAERLFLIFKQGGEPQVLGVAADLSERRRAGDAEKNCFVAGMRAIKDMAYYLTGKGKEPITKLQVYEIWKIVKRFHPIIRVDLGKKLRNVCMDNRIKMTRETESFCLSLERAWVSRAVKMALSKFGPNPRMTESTFIKFDKPFRLGKPRKRKGRKL